MLHENWQKKLYEGVLVKCPVLTLFALVFWNPVVKSKRSLEGISYVRSPSFFLCALIETLLQIVDDTVMVSSPEGTSRLTSLTTPLWDVCSRDNSTLDWTRIVVVILFLIVIGAALLVLILNAVTVAFPLGLRWLVWKAWLRKADKNILLQLPVWSTKLRTD